MPSTEELRSDFEKRFVEVLKDLKENGQKDPEVIWTIGSLTTHIVNQANAKDWPTLRADLSKADFNDLLNQFQDQAIIMKDQGNLKHAYAMQALATSLISRRFNDGDLAQGIELMDAFINQAVKFYAQASANRKKPN